MRLASKPWIKLGLLCLLIILFVAFKNFNKKAEGFTTCPAGTYLNASGSCVTCPKPKGVAVMTSPEGSTREDQCVAYTCSGGYYLYWKDGTCRPEWGAGAGFWEDDFGTTVFRIPQNFKIDSSNIYIGTTDSSGNDISTLVSDRIGNIRSYTGAAETILTILTYANNEYNYSYVQVDSVNTNLFPSDSILSTPYYKLSINFLDQSDPLPTGSINATGANVRISWRGFSQGCSMTPWSTHNTCIPSTCDQTGTRDGTIRNERIVIKSFDHTDASICEKAIGYERTRTEPCTVSGPCPPINCVPGRWESSETCVPKPGGPTCESNANSRSGTRTETRTIRPPSNGGTCSTQNLVTSRSADCRLEICPPPKCNPGQYLDGRSCTNCPSGTYQDKSNFSGTNCKPIPSTNVASSSSSSVTCAAGHTLNSEGTECQANPCTEGTNYNKVTGRVPCTACPPNSSCTATGYTCVSGYYDNGTSCVPIPTGATRNSSGTGFVCNAGYRQSETGCVECGAGTYSTAGSSSCTSCGTDKYTTGTRSTSAEACLSVPTGATRNTSGSGFVCDAGYRQSETGCVECGVGTYSTAGSSSCTSCGADKYTTGPRSTSSEACLSVPTGATRNSSGTGFVCDAGYRQSETGCVECGAGTYSTAGASSCSNCGADKYTTGTRSTSIAACLSLPSGATRNSSGSGFVCDAGYSQNEAGCAECGVGTFSTAGSSSCTTCGSGKYTTGKGSTSSAACLSLPPNTITDPSGGYKCAPGYYNNGTGCVALPPNSIRNSSGTGFDCEAGFYNNGTTCVAVPPNSIRNSSGTGFSCEAGYSQSDTGCTQCGGGTYSVAGSSSCLACAAGTYSKPGASSCSSAPANAVINSSGTGFTCNPGFYNNGTVCVPVPANATRNSSGNGFTCAANYSQSSTACIKCGAGSYSRPGQTACTSCCTFATPAAAVAGGCPDSTRLVLTKNSAKCPSGSRANCCNAGFSTNKACRDQGFWTNSPQFTDNHKRSCTSGFENYGDGIDSIAQKRVKEYLLKNKTSRII